MPQACLIAMLGVFLEDGACFGGEFVACRAWLRAEALFCSSGQGVEFCGKGFEGVHCLSRKERQRRRRGGETISTMRLDRISQDM